MTKIFTKGLVLGLILSVALGMLGCGKNVDTKDDKEEIYYSFTDDLGNEIELKESPKKVAVLFSSYADVWVSAGGEVAISVGESVERGFASEDTILVDAGAGKTIDTEALVAARPDFVICSADIAAQVEVASLLNDNQIPAACFRVEEFKEYLNMLKICTDITGFSQGYELYGLQVQERIEEILAQVAEKTDKKNILFVRAGSSSSATKAKTAEDNFVCKMLKELGTYNIAEEAPILLDGLSIEEILMKDPDYIFISTMGKESAAIEYMSAVFEEPQWQALTAIQEKQYTFLPKDLFQYKPNARWAEAYEYLVDVLYADEE